MDYQIERRKIDRDPIDVLSLEVVSLLKLCGGMRESDRATNGLARGVEEPEDRRHRDLRGMYERG